MKVCALYIGSIDTSVHVGWMVTNCLIDLLSVVFKLPRGLTGRINLNGLVDLTRVAPCISSSYPHSLTYHSCTLYLHIIPLYGKYYGL